MPPTKPTPRPHTYVEAYRLGVGDEKRLVAKISDRDLYVFASSTSDFTDLEQLKAGYKAFERAATTFAEFKRTRFAVRYFQSLYSMAMRKH